MKKRSILVVWVGLAASLFTGCTSIMPISSPTIDVVAIYTQAAKTLTFQLTLDSGSTAAAKLTHIARATPTVLPQSPAPTTPYPTNTPSPATPTPTVTAARTSEVPCNWAEYQADETEAALVLLPGTRFTKTWRLKNIGSCSWTRAYALVFFDGDQMGGEPIVPFTDIVRPGEIIDLSVDLIAPEKEGVYYGYWMLRSASGDFFGIGRGAKESLLVEVRVRTPSEMVHSFVFNICNAVWDSGSGPIPCMGSDMNTESGFVTLYDYPVFENGEAGEEPAIITFPSNDNHGFITGSYPAFQVRAGDHFRTAIGCLYDSFNCSVVFQLNYRADGGPLRKLGNWVEVYDGKITWVDIDLAPLAGKSVEFIFTVLNNGESQDDWAFWLNPLIIR